jgi:hypothetical protein
MLFDDLDRKIREAAEQHHPAYDERAWQKMEKLLNQHLPQQKDDKRRVIFLVFLFLLIGGGAFLVISKPWNKQSGKDQLVSTKQTGVETSTKNKPDNTTNNVPSHQVDKADRKTVAGEIVNPLPQPQKTNNGPVDVTFVSKTRNKNATNASGSKEDQLTQITNLVSNNSTANKAPVQENKTEEANNNTDNPILKSSTVNPANEQKEKINNSNAVQNETKPTTDLQSVKADEKKTSVQKKSGSTKNYFSFFASAGPDVSKAGSSKTGKTTLAYGLGVGYTLNRITLRTGIFASKKIYWADANDYQLAHPIPPTVKFVGADANCDVVEVPLKVSYSFIEKGKNTVFGGAGLSSYFMKKEKYVYNYETGWGTSYTYPYETKNENKHYFSVLNLSAGYARDISKTVSLSAEPYIDVPLVGIGVGKVRLNSAGVLFSVSVKPFRK